MAGGEIRRFTHKKHPGEAAEWDRTWGNANQETNSEKIALVGTNLCNLIGYPPSPQKSVGRPKKKAKGRRNTERSIGRLGAVGKTATSDVCEITPSSKTLVIKPDSQRFRGVGIPNPRPSQIRRF